MKKILILLVLGFIIVFAADTFTLRSGDVKGQLTLKQVFKGGGCEGENISPELIWSHAPSGTKSFALTVYDPDAPTGSGWWHWIVFDIPKSKTALLRGFGNKPSKNIVQAQNDYGIKGFGGACPPVGDKPHRYVFTVYALDVQKLGLDENSNPATIGFALNAHTIQKASIISYYGRK